MGNLLPLTQGPVATLTQAVMGQARADVLPVAGAGGLPCSLGLAPSVAYCQTTGPWGRGCMTLPDQSLGILLWGYCSVGPPAKYRGWARAGVSVAARPPPQDSAHRLQISRLSRLVMKGTRGMEKWKRRGCSSWVS